MNDISFENCIKYTVCITACPVNRVNPGYPGPEQAGSDDERLRLKDGALYDEALRYCINYKRREVACPSGVKIDGIIQCAWAKYNTTRPSLRNFVLSHTDLTGGVPTPFTSTVNTATLLKPVRQLLDAALKIDHRRTLPEYSLGTFRRWYHSVAAQQAQYKDQVAFFHGCLVSYNHLQLSKNLIKILNAMGTSVQLLSKEKYYGVLLIASGFTDKTRKQAIANIESIHEAVEVRGIPVIVTSSTCTFTLRDEYPEALNVNNRGLRDHVELVTRRLRCKLDEGKTLLLKPLSPKVVYHIPCRMEEMGWTLHTLELLHKIPGLELTVLDSQYYGIAGAYDSKKENYPTSQAIGVPLLRRIEKSSADLAVADCEACKWQIEMSTSLRCGHPITLLAQALA